MDDIGKIVDALRQIQEEGGEGNFVIFDVDLAKGYYVQFVAACGEIRLYGEASSASFPDHTEGTLSERQVADLLAMGWEAPRRARGPNFWREWEAANDQDRMGVALEVMRTLTEVYGFSAGKELGVGVELQD